MENDIFRRKRTNLSTEQLLKIDLIKCEAEKLLIAMTPTGELIDPVCLNIAITKLEESVMWVIKGFTKPVVRRIKERNERDDDEMTDEIEDDYQMRDEIEINDFKEKLANIRRED